MNVLFTSAGRRVSLLKHFKHAMSELGLAEGKVIACDAGDSAPASFIADIALSVPRIDSPDYIGKLLEICQQYRVDILIPLIDTDLIILAKTKSRFESIDTRVLV